ncbi:hypothetical protein GGS23DRAFT_598877 [Durotheca rogersii]|uniref:uncharacterized protein n=1 Tax=Durotheca rogersii TaxID=419775 RepID=UPI00221EF3BA|nr:uncharacterized protein GGS23DRAFT_598877 [Durotheca rogersii]KAI5860994.1 hypothetical protein GGS23DRAFT_598877 [Durotheca rogersii]
MCVEFFAKYPCGHVRSTWEYCNKAKARGYLRRESWRAPTPCNPPAKRKPLAADLQDTCGAGCLARVWECRACGAARQFGWRCGACANLRTAECPAWDACACRMHDPLWCHEIVLGTAGKTLCARCRRDCARKAAEVVAAATAPPPYAAAASAAPAPEKGACSKGKGKGKGKCKDVGWKCQVCDRKCPGSTPDGTRCTKCRDMYAIDEEQ